MAITHHSLKDNIMNDQNDSQSFDWNPGKQIISPENVFSQARPIEPLYQGTRPLPFTYDDGGRASAGYKGEADDCVVRSIAIATGKPYQDVYDQMNAMAKRERPRKGQKRSSSRTGVKTPTVRRYMESIGWVWTPTMQIGSGCRVHLRIGELPSGRLVVRVSKHMAAVIDGKIHDTGDPSRDGTRCVYGYWTAPESSKRRPTMRIRKQLVVDCKAPPTQPKFRRKVYKHSIVGT